jgi:peptidoglycan/LPS O-acetylase OafA/YrhL
MRNTNKRILSIEAIRGMAAIYVMLGHLVLLYKPYQFFPGYEFVIKTIFGFGHQAVLLFFIVSGFSITYSSPNFNENQKIELREYYFKRFRRIYPLFFISLIISVITLLITENSFELRRIILSFVFLTDISKGSISNPISTNFPIWSLSYEVIYYILFPTLYYLITRFGKKRTFIIVLAVSIIAGSLNLLTVPNHLFNVFQYSWVWLAGSYLAAAYRKRTQLVIKNLNGLVIFSVAFMLTIEQIPIIRDWFWSLFFILCFSAFLINATETRKKYRFISLLIGLISIVFCFFLTFNNSITYHSTILRVFLLLLFVVNIVIHFSRITIQRRLIFWLVQKFSSTGSISYALYIIHWPIIILFIFLYKTFFEMNLVNTLSVITINIGMIFFISSLLEIKLQPIIVKISNQFYYKKERQRILSK